MAQKAIAIVWNWLNNQPMKRLKDWYAELTGDQMVYLVLALLLAFNVASALLGWGGFSAEDDGCVRYTSHVSNC